MFSYTEKRQPFAGVDLGTARIRVNVEDVRKVVVEPDAPNPVLHVIYRDGTSDVFTSRAGYWIATTLGFEAIAQSFPSDTQPPDDATSSGWDFHIHGMDCSFGTREQFWERNK